LFGTIEQHISRLHPLSQFDGKEQASHYEHLYENSVMYATDRFPTPNSQLLTPNCH
jgi:hypothetical protein